MATNPKVSPISRREMIRRICAMPEGPHKEAMMDFAIARYGTVSQAKKFKPYKFKPAEYISTFLKWSAWTGIDDEHPGQSEILAACAHVMLQQQERDRYEKGEMTEEQLTCWKPGEIIKNWIRVESGNGIGKTKSSSGILNWFLDCFVPSAIFTFAPGGDQARFAMWSEIRGDREGKGLPGRILEKEIKISAKHFAAHRTVSEGLGKGEERLKGKHEEFQLFILDEADGISETVFDAVTSMTSGGHSLVIMFANPKSRSTMFHRIKSRSYVQTFRVSTLFHPNVVQGKEVVPGAVKRGWVETKIENDCDVIHFHTAECPSDHQTLHREDDFTFELPYSVTVAGVLYPAGTIFKPNARFMTDILGITPPNSTDNTLIPVGRFEAACKRVPKGGDKTFARVGLDAARGGEDLGKMYIRWQDAVWMACEFLKQDTDKYVDVMRTECLKLKEKGVVSLHIRIDAAYGNGIIDALRKDDDLIEAFEDYEVFEVHFGGKPYSNEYYHLVTEMYAEAAESIKSLCILSAPERLEIDLCEREYLYRNKAGKTVKILEDKPGFKKRKKHSPDDGDGFVMAVAPDYCFNNLSFNIVSAADKHQPQVNRSSAMDDLLNLLGK